MKKVVFLSVLTVCAVFAFAQESYTYDSQHYSVRSFVSAEHAQEMADRLEAYLVAFNQYFHFGIDDSALKMKVRVFADKARYDQYLQRLINETRDEYVYLHYSDQARSELVGFEQADAEIPESSISHQAFIQFLRAHIPNPPLWLREGFAVYFEELTYDPETKTALARENLSWLETLKDLIMGERVAEALPLDSLLSISVDEARQNIEVFYPQAWSVVQYLARSDVKAHNRILWDAINLMTPEATLEENSSLVGQRAFQWEDAGKLVESYLSYFESKKTYAELIQDGIDAYAASKPVDAEKAFMAALELRDDSYVPHYYLGLINYDRAAYAQAETYYQKALSMGADSALTNYALGVNAFADNRFDIATGFLEQTVATDPSFQEKVNELLARMES